VRKHVEERIELRPKAKPRSSCKGPSVRSADCDSRETLSSTLSSLWRSSSDGTCEPRKRPVWAEHDNILASNYTLCVRGAGNFCSILRHTRSGRVPVLIATDGGISFDFAIDGGASGPVIPANDLNRNPEILLECHNRQTLEQFVLRQQQNRLSTNVTSA
jgi:hypothetical protein